MKQRKDDMNYKLRSCPLNLNTLLNENQTLSIHSIFNNTVNLHYHNSLITLQHQSVVLSPMSVSLGITQNQFSELFNHDENHVFIKDCRLIINGTEFSDDSMEWVDYQLSYNNIIEHTPLSSWINRLDQSLQQQNDKSDLVVAYHCFLNKTHIPEQPLGATFYDLLTLLNEPSNQQWLYSCVRMIGMGEGLTPSGDDFICGLLASLQFCLGKEDLFVTDLIKALKDNIHKTTMISQAYLSHAMEGRYMKSIHTVYHALVSNGEIDDIVDEFKQIGHSSGIDTLIGINFGLKLGGKVK